MTPTLQPDPRFLEASFAADRSAALANHEARITNLEKADDRIAASVEKAGEKIDRLTVAVGGFMASVFAGIVIHLITR